MKLAIAAGVSLGLLVTACSQFQFPSPTDLIPAPVVQPNANPTFIAIKDGIVKACGVVPTVETVANIVATFTSFTPEVVMVEQIINGFCSAIRAQGARRGHKPTYRGITLHYSRA